MRPKLSAVQLQRAIENAGGLWSVIELRRMGVLRWGDRIPQGTVTVTVQKAQDRRFVDNFSRYFTGYDMLRFCEEQQRPAAAEVMEAAITARLRAMQTDAAVRSRREQVRRRKETRKA